LNIADLSSVDGVATIGLAGELDLTTVPMLREHFVAVFADGHTSLVLDARELDFLDSTGISVLVGARNRATTAGGEFKIVNASARIVKVLEIVRLDELLLGAD
jgi:anti-anti-sigma factor